MSYTPLIPPSRSDSPDVEIYRPLNGDPLETFVVPTCNVPGEHYPKRLYAHIGCALCICVTLSVAAFVLYKLGMLTNSE